MDTQWWDDDEATEVEYLEYLVDKLKDAVGPAAEDVVFYAQKDFEIVTCKRVPGQYRTLQ